MDQCFLKVETDFKLIKNEVQFTKRDSMALFTRLTPNTTNWQGPSGSDNKCAGTSLRLFEHRAGFGFEEWYCSPDFRKVDEHGVEWQYGYWQCFKNPNRKTFVPGL